jgi:hypothetical protein
MSKRDRRIGGKKKVRAVTPETQKFAKLMLGDAIPYEVGMMRTLYKKLVKGSPCQLRHNAYIESFHMHARNMIEFFKDDKQCAIDPRTFTNKDYQVQGNFISSNLEKRISQQIVHLTHERTDDKKLKLGDQAREQTLAQLEKQIKRFESALLPQWVDVWRDGLKKMDFDGPCAPSQLFRYQGWTGPASPRIETPGGTVLGPSSHPTFSSSTIEPQLPPVPNTPEDKDE